MEALRGGAYEAGVKVSSAYPERQAPEISEAIAKIRRNLCRVGSNEKRVAAMEDLPSKGPAVSGP